MATTAEGVETREQLDELRAEGCTEVQGYLFSRPMAAAAIAELLGVAAKAASEPAPRQRSRRLVQGRLKGSPCVRGSGPPRLAGLEAIAPGRRRR